MIVAFTGHRKLGGYGPSPIQTAVRAAIKTLLVEHDVNEAVSGMALGVDQWAAEVCIELSIPFTAAVPFDGQEWRWPSAAQLRYRELIAKAWHVQVVCPGEYAAWKMQRRNEWMVNNSDTLLAVWDGSSGGTANCVQYAREVGREIWHVDPNRLQENP